MCRRASVLVIVVGCGLAEAWPLAPARGIGAWHWRLDTQTEQSSPTRTQETWWVCEPHLEQCYLIIKSNSYYW